MPNRSFYHPLPPPSKEGVKGKGIPSGGASAPSGGARKSFSYTIKASAPSGEPGNGFLIPSKPLLLSQEARKRISRPR